MPRMPVAERVETRGYDYGTVALLGQLPGRIAPTRGLVRRDGMIQMPVNRGHGGSEYPDCQSFCILLEVIVGLYPEDGRA
jgi:hypothetical protein